MERIDIIFILLWLSLLGTSVIFKSEKNNVKLQHNPLFKELESLNKEKGWGFQFDKRLLPGWDLPTQSFATSIHKNAKEVDIILVGDSSVNYGIYAQLLSSLTQKKILIIAYPALRVSDELLNFVESNVKKYLKKDGLIVFMFDPLFWLKRDGPAHSNTLINDVINTPLANNCLFCQTTFIAYKKRYHQLFELSLFSIDFYAQLVEPWTAPRWSKKKYKNSQGLKKNERRYLLDDWSVLIVKDNSKPSYNPENILEESVNKLPKLQPLKEVFKRQKHQLVLVIPVVEEKNIYRKYLSIMHTFEGLFNVINLTEILSYEHIEIQNRTHTANLGIFKQTEGLAKQLNLIFNQELQ